MNRRFFQKGSILYDFVDTYWPDLLRVRTYMQIRKAVLDRPVQTVANRRKYIRSYAIFCATVPYAVAGVLLVTVDYTGIVPPTLLDQRLGELRVQERELIEQSAESRATCTEIRVRNESAGKRCAAVISRVAEGWQGEIDTARAEIESFKRFNLVAVISIFTALFFLFSSVIFSRIWLRFYPAHLYANVEDIDRVKRAYLLIMSTTILVPGFIGAFVLVVANIAMRYDTSTLNVFSGWVTIAGNLPFAVCNVLGCFRLNQVLLGTTNWRIGKTWLIIALSNLVTVIVIIVFAIIAFLVFL